MWRMFCVLLLLFWGVAESRHIKPLQESLKTVRTSVAIFPNGLGGTTGLHLSRIEAHPNVIDADVDDLVLIREPNLKRAPRVPRDGRTKQRETQFSQNFRYPRPYDAGGYFTTPRNTDSPNHSHGRRRNDTNPLGIHNPLYPVTDDSYGAYAVMLLSLIVFAVGIVGNLAVMCIVWQNYYMKTTWNCILASLAFWDFLVLFFCLPVVIFNELTKRRLLGDLSCRIVPYMEVTSLGVATFSLCALSIDRFHTATSIQPKPRLVEPCQSILAKLSVVWVGSMVLAAPELLLWQLHKDVSPLTGLPLDMCVQRPSPDLPESVFSLVLTYHEARMWWSFGCFFCLPLLFTLACQLLTRHVTEEAKQASTNGRSLSTSIKSSSSSSSSSSSPKRQQQQQREQQLTRTVIALAAVYGVCGLPENAANIVLTSAGLEVSVGVHALLQLVGQFLMFARASATPVILLCLCRALGQTFMDCCCCCCEECLPDRSSSTSTTSSASSQVTATTGTTGTSSSPSASPVSSVPEEKLQIISGTTPTPAILFDKAKDDSSILAIGTPC